MAYGDITANTQAWATPDIAGGFLSAYSAAQQAKANSMAMERMQRQQAQEDQLRQAMQGFDNKNPQEGLARLYAISPDYAANLEKTFAEKEKASVDLNNSRLSGKKTEIDIDAEERKLMERDAVGLAISGRGRSPEEQRALLEQRMSYWERVNPNIAQKYKQNLDSPEIWRNIDAIATQAGFEDPQAKQARDIDTFRQQEIIKNQMPLSAKEAAQNDQARQQRLTDQQRSEERWLIDKHDAAPETITYKRVLPKANAVLAAIKSPDPQSDLDIMMGLTNILDELGSVRESDIANIKSAGSWAQWLDNLQSELKQNGKLGPESRKGIANIVGRRMQEYESSYMAHRRNLDARATKSGLNPQELFADPMPFAGKPQGVAPQGQAQPATRGGSFREGQTATNRATGQRMVYRGGQWRPL